MKVHVPSACAALLAALGLFAFPALTLAQEPPPPEPEEALRLEESHIELVATHGHSHASGAREDLGPTILGNPTQAAVALRVGLYYSFNASGAFSEFSTLHHPFVKVSATVGTVHVRDRSSGHLIVDVEPGMIVDVRHDGTGYLVSVDGAAALGPFAGPVAFDPTD
ncbi:MAG TPA: hypothetical protein VFO85_00740, partial [Vicinamibacteria bacterium]|nr:hypothetical protein [Vicinamibacteria bacterium]